jgi:hypothetical protein
VCRCLCFDAQVEEAIWPAEQLIGILQKMRQLSEERIARLRGGLAGHRGTSGRIAALESLWRDMVDTGEWTTEHLVRFAPLTRRRRRCYKKLIAMDMTKFQIALVEIGKLGEWARAMLEQTWARVLAIIGPGRLPAGKHMFFDRAKGGKHTHVLILWTPEAAVGTRPDKIVDCELKEVLLVSASIAFIDSLR